MNTLWIARAGVSEDDITLGVERALARAGRVLISTRQSGLADYLTRERIPFEALDALYERAEDFDAHARMVADYVISCAQDEVVYAVMSLPDASARELIKRFPSARVIGAGQWGELWARAEGATLCLSASDWELSALSADASTIVTEIDNRLLASEIKLKLMEHYPETSDIVIVRGGRAPERISLTELDRVGGYDHRFGCLINAQRAFNTLERFDFAQLTRLVAALRDPVTGDVWDIKQDNMSIKRAAIEEAYELEDAIISGDTSAVIEELGDILFICALHAQIGAEHGEFTISDIVTGVCQKMLRRHPHIFGGEHTRDEALIHKIWAQVKSEEKHFKSPADAMRAVAKSLPALTRAAKILKIAREHSEFGSLNDALSRAREAALALAGADENAERAAGDMLMTCASACVLCSVDPEQALSHTINRFLDELAPENH